MTSEAIAMPRDANYSDEQHQLAQVCDGLFASINPTSRVRALWGAPEPRERLVWKQIAQVGLTGIGVPESLGGIGGDANDLVMVLEAVGRHLVPEPVAATVAVMVPTLVSVGGAVADEWLPRLLAGEATATLSFAQNPHLMDADDADLILVERESTLWLDTRVPHAVRLRSEDGSRRVFARPDLRGQMLGGADLLEEARMRSTAATAAELVGVCDALVEQCVQYARVRTQFGTAIGGFQAIQHLLANMFVAVESARGAVRHAARRLAAAESDAGHAASIAKAAAAKAHRRVNTDALQLFGGIGFTWEHDLHLWLKRGLALEAQDGTERDHRRRIADQVFSRVAPRT
ncbi:MAG: alkylation response protein AidB-like acyl-CoA dehydrogenase [Glaciecola sp.]|jgi:alkylation response protein AidB-like acyl-CoA dehydrogenase